MAHTVGSMGRLYIYRQALGFAHPPTIGYLTNQLLGILPTNLQHSFYQFFSPPPLATHAFNDSGSSTTFLLSMFPPPLATHV